jgi:hypothetical protein
MLKTLFLLLKWYYRTTPTISEGNDSSETKTGTPSLPTKYEINVSKNGKHVFATDSHYRTYRECDIIKQIELFKAAFPDCKISVRSWREYTLPLSEELQKAAKDD